MADTKKENKPVEDLQKAKLPPAPQKEWFLSNEDRTKMSTELKALLQIKDIPTIVKTALDAALIYLDPKINDTILNINKVIKDLDRKPQDTNKTLSELSKELKKISAMKLQEDDFPTSLKVHVNNANNLISKLDIFISQYNDYLKATKDKDRFLEKTAAVIKSWSEFKTAYNKAGEDLYRFNNDMRNEDKKSEFKKELLWHQLGF